MKKSLLIVTLVLSAFSILAVEYFSGNQEDSTSKQCSATHKKAVTKVERNPNFNYAIGSRFSNTITREALIKATKVDDLISADAMNYVESMWDVKLSVISSKKNPIEKGDDRVLTEEQLDILQSLEYNTECNITALCILKDRESGQLTEGYFDDYFTVTPEKEANYKGGKDAITDYLRSKSSELTKKAKQKKLEVGMIRFVVTKEGAIADASLDSSCGYSAIDEALLKLVMEMPKKWSPAENAIGENVDQEFVFFYGQAGC